jgi:hypothetical protein
MTLTTVLSLVLPLVLAFLLWLGHRALGQVAGRKIERLRNETLLKIQAQRVDFQDMALRCQAAGQTPDPNIVSGFQQGIASCEKAIRDERDVSQFDQWTRQAEICGQLRAYVCPSTEIETVAWLAIQVMKDWGVQQLSIDSLQQMIEREIKNTTSIAQARGALRAILKERDVMDRYTDEYEDDLRRISSNLARLIIVFLVGSLLAFVFSSRVHVLIAVVLFFAGAAGSCVSVLSRMPNSEVASSQASVSLRRRIMGRVSTGLMASITGCALLAWGILPIAVDKISFRDVLEACQSSGADACSNAYMLIVLAVPMMFGFSELILTRLVERFLGRSATEDAEA